LMLTPDGNTAGWPTIIWVVFTAIVGLLPLAAGAVGFLFSPLRHWQRIVLIFSSFVILLLPHNSYKLVLLVTLLVCLVIAFLNWKKR